MLKEITSSMALVPASVCIARQRKSSFVNVLQNRAILFFCFILQQNINNRDRAWINWNLCVSLRRQKPTRRGFRNFLVKNQDEAGGSTLLAFSALPSPKEPPRYVCQQLGLGVTEVSVTVPDMTPRQGTEWAERPVTDQKTAGGTAARASHSLPVLLLRPLRSAWSNKRYQISSGLSCVARYLWKLLRKNYWGENSRGCNTCERVLHL